MAAPPPVEVSIKDIPRDIARLIVATAKPAPVLRMREFFGMWHELDPAQPYVFKPPVQPSDETPYKQIVEEYGTRASVYYNIEQDGMIKMQLDFHIHELELHITNFQFFARDIQRFENEDYAYIQLAQYFTFTKQDGLLTIETSQNHMQQFKWKKYGPLFLLILRNMLARAEAMADARKGKIKWW